MTVLLAAIAMTEPKPLTATSSSDNIKLLDKPKATNEIPVTTHPWIIHRLKPRAPCLREARHSAAISAPPPEAPERNPKVDASPWKTSLAKTGSKTPAGIAHKPK